MQLLRCLLVIIYTTDITRAQKKVQAGPRSLQLQTTQKIERARNKENKGRKPNIIILTQPSAPETSMLPLLLNKNRKKPYRADCFKEK